MSMIYRANNRKKGWLDLKRLTFYAYVGLAYMLPWLLSDWVSHPDTFAARLVNNIWRALYIVAVNYIFFEHILPALSGKRIFRSLLLLAAQFLLYSFGQYFWRTIGVVLHIWTPLITHDSLLDGVCYYFPYSVASFFFFGLVKHIYDHIQLRQTAQQLRIEKQEAELNYLKSQTNPHFLFNTLNNIYSLSKDKSDLAPESILRLSEILRFMLYETSGNYIRIEQEIKIIGDYLALEQLRYDDTLRLNFKYEVPDMKQPIPPLLLIPLVENAFKHGASETRHQPFVDIHLKVERQVLTLLVKNSTEHIPEEERQVKENIGFSNLRRQLELLYTEYELSAEQGASEFTTTLTINLASHV